MHGSCFLNENYISLLFFFLNTGCKKKKTLYIKSIYKHTPKKMYNRIAMYYKVARHLGLSH